jgi:hypothetical protein
MVGADDRQRGRPVISWFWLVSLGLAAVGSGIAYRLRLAIERETELVRLATVEARTLSRPVRQ